MPTGLSTPPKAAVPSCPRCGYELTGIIDTWDDCCPVGGTCSECGGALRWLDVFYPHRADCPGFIEHVRADGAGALGLVAIPAASARTLAWTLRPGRFWTIIQTHQRVVPARMVLWLVLVLLIPHLAASGMGLLAYAARINAAGVLAGGIPPLDSGVVASHLLFPVAAYRDGLGPMGVIPQWNTWPEYVLPALVFSVAWPALWLALPVTRARAKLRWAHVARAAVYQCTWIALLIAYRFLRNLWVIANVIGTPNPVRVVTPRLGDTWPAGVACVLFAWLGAWWYFAIVRGWRIERGRWLWAALAAASGLMATIAAKGSDILDAWVGLLGG